MFALRRAGVRALLTQPIRQLSTHRPAARASALHVDKPSLCRLFHQSRLWLAEEDAKRAEASPADATTSGETVTTEPSSEEQNLREESIATPDVVESAKSAGESAAAQAQEKAQEAVSQTQDTASEVAAQTQEKAQEAVSQTQDTASEVAAQAQEKAQGASSQAQSTASSTVETVQNVASSAAQTVQNAVSSAAQTARGTFQRDRAPKAPSKILYVGNLFFEVTRPQLEAEFSKFGEITNSRIVLDGRGLSKGFGYIEFADQESADRALKELNQQVLQGRTMSVQYHQRRDQRSSPRSQSSNEPSKTLFVGNMSYQMSDRDLNDLFREIRNVLDVRVAIDRRTGQPRGFAHADFIDIESAEKAKAHLEQKIVYGRQLRVDFSHSSPATTQS